MKIKTGYYIPQLPTKIAITLLDGTTKITDMIPARHISAEELKPLLAIESGMWKPECFDEWPPFVYALYGLEKID